ncbi:hypothetical protein HYW75_00845 [Candidatus Pacearchaeota archaeon]|nr:hypothetical protein [Candidatus Pacearchaeota archaeon]
MDKKDNRIICTEQWGFHYPENLFTPNITLFLNRAYFLEPFALELKRALEVYFPSDLEIRFKRDKSRLDPLGFFTDGRVGNCAIFLFYDPKYREKGAIASLRARRPIDLQMTFAIRREVHFNPLTFIRNFVKSKYCLKGVDASVLRPEAFYEPKMFS